MELRKKIDDTCKIIDEIADLFYMQKINEGYVKMQKFIDDVTLITDSLENINQKYNEKILHMLGDTLNAMEEKDVVLLSDILNYDFKELLIQIEGEV